MYQTVKLTMQLRLQQLLSWSNYLKYDFCNLKQLKT